MFANTAGEDSASSSSFHKTRQLLLKVVESGASDSKSSKKSRRARAGQKDPTIIIHENKEEDYASVVKSNTRTIDLVKQTMGTGGTLFH